tara:strand:- start:1820 stop:4336 length:2517 start_codon:yes stop_codon:yes gene_type:complete
MDVSFLEASNGLPLSKVITSKGTKPYPFVKNVTSHKYSVTGIGELFDLIQKHAALGHCLLKGNPKHDLVDRSRAGSVRRQDLNQLLVLDFDGIDHPAHYQQTTYTAGDVSRLAEVLVHQLPDPLHSVSYIAQASSSLGFKGSKISMHMIFMLKVALPPATQKLWLTNTNAKVKLLRDQVGLSVNGLSLTYPLDVSLADNSKLIFIAPPQFQDGVVNPFVTNDDRMALVRKTEGELSLDELVDLSPEAVYNSVTDIKNKLRKDQGYSRKKEKLQMANVNNRSEEVLTNPDRMTIQVANTSYLPWVNCNINNGDSAAYYFNLNRPNYMLNFKGEPIFEIEKVDPDFYASIHDVFEDYFAVNGKTCRPVCLRDFDTDTYFNGLYDPNVSQFDDSFPLTPSSQAGIQSFMATHGALMPEIIMDAKIFFDPTERVPTVDLQQSPMKINLYRRTQYMMNPCEPDKRLGVGEASLLHSELPLISKLILHVLGDGDQEFERFINWLAYIFQTRKKTGTAWVFTGVQGTGKGVFYSHILRPLFGSQHVPMKAIQSIEEQFNSYMRSALFMIVDEFHMASASSGTMKMADKLKNQITEPTQTIRAMRSNQIEVPNFCNYIFLTNRADAVKLEETDRRYNIAPRQETTLIEAHPDIVDNLDKIEEELPLFAGYLATFKVSERLVKTPIVNEAKELMRQVSLSDIEEFFQSFRTGDLLSFIDVLDIDVTDVMKANEYMTAKRTVKGWIADSKRPYCMIKLAQMKVIYDVLIATHSTRMSPKQFGKVALKNGIKVVRKRPHGAHRSVHAVQGAEVKWKLDDLERQDLINKYFKDPEDQKLLETAHENSSSK